MRRRVALLIAVVLTVGVATAAPATAHKNDGGTYMALGDSVAAGTQQPLPFTDNGYPNLLFDWLEKRGFDAFVNLACPGDDSAEMIDGDGGIDGSVCYGTGSPSGISSQLAAALGYLALNPDEVKLITLTIGANDVLPCGADFACTAAAVAAIDANLKVIIPALKAAAPGVPIVAMNYYSPNLAFWLVTPEPGQDDYMSGLLALTTFGNDSLEASYSDLGVPVADVERAFKTTRTKGKTPKNVKEVCKLTLMCEKAGGNYILSDYDPGTPGPQTDIHPSNKGHEKIAKTFEKLIKKQKLLK